MRFSIPGHTKVVARPVSAHLPARPRPRCAAAASATPTASAADIDSDLHGAVLRVREQLAEQEGISS